MKKSLAVLVVLFALAFWIGALIGALDAKAADSFYDKPVLDATTSNLVVEVARAVAAEVALSVRIIAETNRAQLAEAALSVRVVAETNRAQVAEALLASQVDLVAETNRAQNAEKTAVTITEGNMDGNRVTNALDVISLMYMRGLSATPQPSGAIWVSNNLVVREP